ncbi:MAG: nitroreductase family protein [Chloroflexota bacterium]
MELFQAIKERQSIRAYKSTPVDDATLNRILDAAHQAPSWGNSQTWRFIVVRDKGVKEQLASGVLRPGNRATEATKQAPVLVALCAELNKAGFRDGQPSTNKEGYWFMFDAGLAMQNLMLAAKSLGLGTCCLGGFDAAKAGQILGIPEGYAVVALTPLGYPDEKPEARPRKELNELVFYNKFGNTGK